MIELTLADLVRHTGGRLYGADNAFTSISTDTRALPQGALFVALKGPSFDGHAFASTALERGAAGALVDHELPIALPQVVVHDVLPALSTFASAWRDSFSVPVIGITGSNGKTTTKEIIGSILSLRGAALITQGNLNNHIGVPLTLLRLNASHRTAVIEMGANHGGEIAALSAMAKPSIGIITNAGAAHLEGFGGLEGVARGKGELFQALPATGVAVVNADDHYAKYWRDHTQAKVMTYGLQASADFTARDITRDVSRDMKPNDASAAFEFDLVTPIGTARAQLALVGDHNLRNALGAAAAAHAAGATLDEIVAGLAAMRPVSGRLQVKAAKHGAYLIDDSYNANPSSMRAGLDALQSRPGKHWLVLGEMRELGPEANELHAQIGRYAREHDVEQMFAVGDGARFAVESFGSGAQWFADVNQLTAAVSEKLNSNITVLIKGSRANRLERVVAALSTTSSSENTIDNNH